MSGKGLPVHGHSGPELTLVVRGSYRDQLGRYAIGDVADLDDDAMHRPVAESGCCICLVGAAGPARYRSLFGRLWQLLWGL
jgi:putative transcriptional regulator